MVFEVGTRGWAPAHAAARRQVRRRPRAAPAHCRLARPRKPRLHAGHFARQGMPRCPRVVTLAPCPARASPFSPLLQVPTLPTLFALVDLLEVLRYTQLQLYMEHTFQVRYHVVPRGTLGARRLWLTPMRRALVHGAHVRASSGYALWPLRARALPHLPHPLVCCSCCAHAMHLWQGRVAARGGV